MKDTPTRRIQGGVLESLGAVENTLNDTISKIKNPDFINKMLAKAAREVRPMVQQMLLDNYKSTGIGTNSRATYQHQGLIEKALKDTKVYLRLDKRKLLRVSCTLPRGMEPYKNQKGDNTYGFYKVFQSLNSGSVRGASAKRPDGRGFESIMARRSKKTLKKLIAGEALNAGLNRQQIAGRTVARRRLEAKLAAIEQMTGKKVTARKAYNFFELDDGQTQRINSAAMMVIRSELQKALTGMEKSNG